MELRDPVTVLKGLGPKKAQALEKLNIRTLEDLLYFFPREYQDRRDVKKIKELQQDQPVLVRGRIELIVKDGYRYGKKQKLRLLVKDEDSSMEVIFFHAGYLSKLFEKGVEYDFYGKPSVQFGRLQMIHPDFARSEKGQMGRILPVYPLTAGLSQKEMRSWQQTVQELIEQIEEPLPEELLQKNRLCSFQFALKNIHFPEEKSPLRQGKFRLIFDELLTLQTGLLASRQLASRGKTGAVFDRKVDILEYSNTFPYDLTNAQKRVIGEIVADLDSGRVMNRLVQGDVGSGKTAVAEIALYKAVKSGYQGVLMAPTELLAKQHYNGVKKNFEPFGIRVELLTGGIGAAQRRRILEELADGTIQILIGTHAIIQPDVRFHKLGLVITDEQHRFGVNQRNLLQEKGENPHVLVMTATPIPRTLAVILFGDLDISIIDELPPNRQKIVTRAFEEQEREKGYDFIFSQLQQGRQAYVVAPLIDESEALDVKSTEALYEELSVRFQGYTAALLYGTMKQKEKDEIMERFYQGEIQILVSTVVIEVGINVPNATVMVIENAERFGLAQLHQLRGRVGRGEHQSFCILIHNATSEIGKARMKIMTESQDGFYIAEKDLEIRGPGDLFGTRQHGIPDLNLADLVKHIKILDQVKAEAKRIIEEDPFLEARKYKGLRENIIKLFGADFTLKL